MKRIVIVGVGNGANSFLMHREIGGCRPDSTCVVTAFGFDVRKVGKDVAEAGGVLYPRSSCVTQHPPKQSSECDA